MLMVHELTGWRCSLRFYKCHVWKLFAFINFRLHSGNRIPIRERKERKIFNFWINLKIKMSKYVALVGPIKNSKWRNRNHWILFNISSEIRRKSEPYTDKNEELYAGYVMRHTCHLLFEPSNQVKQSIALKFICSFFSSIFSPVP